MAEAEPQGFLEPTVAVERASGLSSLVLFCDHASNHIPARYGDLGLTAEDRLKHFAWDPGALGVSRALAEKLDAPLIYGLVSRLALDVNRDPDDSDSIVTAGDARPVPGNLDLSAAERRLRVHQIYRPYHQVADELLRARVTRHQPTALAAIHTYTPRLNGVERPWHCGVIFSDSARMSGIVVRMLRRDRQLVVGVNEPYAPSDRVYHTMERHGAARGRPSVMIEIRNDLVADAESQKAWAERLAPALMEAAEGVL
jgi:predicted N-formylglutamate amidohydrolase